MPSSIRHCRVRPPKWILRFQSLLLDRPEAASNSLGVNHSLFICIHRPRPPATQSKKVRRVIHNNLRLLHMQSNCNKYNQQNQHAATQDSTGITERISRPTYTTKHITRFSTAIISCQASLVLRNLQASASE